MPILQRSVLIVDDSAEDSIAFQRYLQREPDVEYTCHVASTVAEGLNACRSLRPDVILLDYSLPDDTGLAFLEALMAEHGSLAFAVVMLTGSGDEAVAVQALKLGAHDYLVKENHFQQRLTLAVAGAIDKVQLQRQLDQQRRDLEASNRQLRQALDERQSSEAQLRMALGAARMATWEWDLATNQVKWGEGLAEMLGIPDGEFGGNLVAFEQLVHPDDLALVRERLDLALRDDAPYEVEFRMLRRGGGLRWTATHGTVVRDPQGTPIRVIGVDMDISERKRAEAELRESEERYRALVTATSHIVWRTTAAGDSVFATSQWSDLTGQGITEMRGWGWMEAIHPDDREPAAARWQQAIVTQTLYENEFRVRARDGSYRHFQVRGVPIFAADGSLREWIGANTDITSRKRAEAELLRSEAQFKTLVENASDVITRFDRQLRHLYVSPAIARASGIAPAAFLGKTNRELDMDGELCDLWETHLRQVFETGHEAMLEFEYPSPEGILYFQSTLIPETADDGSVDTVMSIAHDITIYKQAESRMRFLAMASKTLATSLDYESTLEHLTRLAIPYLGDACIIDLAVEQQAFPRAVVAHTDPEQEALLREMRATYPPAWTGTHPVAQVQRSGQPLMSADIPRATIEMHQHNGHHRSLIQQLTPRSFLMLPFVMRGKSIGVVSLYATRAARRYTHDDLALAEELIRRAALALENAELYQEAQEAIREREAFLLIASHEVKNPLTTLLGRSQMLRRRLERRDDNARELSDLKVINDSGQRINQLLSDLLDASRVISGQLSVELIPIDPGALVRRVVSEIQPSAPDHRISISERATMLAIAGDARRLEQVFHNLISNAIKYSPAGGDINVEIGVQDGRARITVSDHGLGIPAAALPNLFKRFYRVSHASTQQIAGSGIGLYVVKEIVAGHGGTVDVSSTEGAGSTFTVNLPLFVLQERPISAG
jgi:PAS domain S-box-containing protein